eukprot:CAMPEP_0168501404 /NCGR_PEP_ID=MMETSP0228-20121227/74785_1 /TAXON_ID=133427 /ORGANISM="Protoceratium reticulatum, Strain CCCM 535 (=CCMP 1889)" /LENGTH=321 /DNA_ID=CAMNT_0008518353 /DNA_START=82 /DNA_END=1044 /DNA_ORIENTATION=+
MSAAPPDHLRVQQHPANRRAATGPAAGADDSPRGGSGSAAVRLMLDTKVSGSGTPTALFDECIAAIRQRRAELDQDDRHVDTQAITKLRQDELELTRKIFQRVDPSGDLTSDLAHAGHEVDPYWSPFRRVRDLREQVTAEFDEYARYVSVAEQKRVRVQVKRSLRRSAAAYNPYSAEAAAWHGRSPGEQPPRQPPAGPARPRAHHLEGRRRHPALHRGQRLHPPAEDDDAVPQEAAGAGQGSQDRPAHGAAALQLEAARLPGHAADGPPAMDRGPADGADSRGPRSPLPRHAAGDDGAAPGAGLQGVPQARGPAGRVRGGG